MPTNNPVYNKFYQRYINTVLKESYSFQDWWKEFFPEEYKEYKDSLKKKEFIKKNSIAKIKKDLHQQKNNEIKEILYNPIINPLFSYQEIQEALQKWSELNKLQFVPKELKDFFLNFILMANNANNFKKT